MAFKKGQSGNPGGRPKEDENIKAFRDLAKQYSLAALQFLVDTFQDEEANLKCRIAAAHTVIEYGQGKPLQPTKEIQPGQSYLDFIKALDI